MGAINFLLFAVYLVLCVNLNAQPVNSIRDSLWNVDEISNTTIYLSQKINDQERVGGSATLINHSQKFYLLTASHVSNFMKSDCQIVFRGANDKPVIFNLSLLTKGNKIDWTNQPEADVSIVELFPINSDFLARFNTWSFPSKQIFGGQQTIPRDIEATFFGYPILDMDEKHFSALSFNSYLASGLITARRYDTNTKSTFFYLDQPSMQGTSGGGVFCSIKKAMFMNFGKTLMIGIVHGTARDNTGGKLAAITPSFYIIDLLNQLK